MGRVPPPSDTVAPTVTTPTVGEAESNELPNEGLSAFEVPENAFVAALVGLVLVAFAISILHALYVTLRELLPLLRRRARSAKVDVTVLPEIERADIALDIESQLSALAHGEPRNAIVACWLQLEDDVARAGLPRRASETSAEFTVRVLASYSLDPAPVADLAALYREARFSEHPMEQADRDRALVALRQIHVSLDDPVTMAPSTSES